MLLVSLFLHGTPQRLTKGVGKEDFKEVGQDASVVDISHSKVAQSLQFLDEYSIHLFLIQHVDLFRGFFTKNVRAPFLSCTPCFSPCIPLWYGKIVGNELLLFVTFIAAGLRA